MISYAFMRLGIGLLLLSAFLHAGADDIISFGNADSEKSHKISAENSETVIGGLGQPARRLLPLPQQNWEGGNLKFKMNVDPDKPNYATIRLWGSDTNPGRLILFCNGKQIGYRQLGDIDILDDGSHDPAIPGKFYYVTSPLPLELTRGKQSLEFEIRATGPIWRYGKSFEQYQKTMTEPTRGIYRFYLHTNGCFNPPDDEKPGVPPAEVTVRKSPGPEVIDHIKEQVNSELSKCLKSTGTLDENRINLLAKGYNLKWTPAYHNPTVIQHVLKSLDNIAEKYRNDPKTAEGESWLGLGGYGSILNQLAEPLKPYLNEERRKNYSDMLVHSRDWRRTHRRSYANQSQIVDLYGIYMANRGIAVVDPDKALPETAARRYLYESMGITPWLGSDTANGPERPYGDDFYIFTAKGLTKELGFVGGYGEVAMILTGDIYNATRPAPDQPGDEKIKEQAIKVARARAPFRYPALDSGNNRAMRLEHVVSWRDLYHPGAIVYGMRTDRAASELKIVSVTLDPFLVGYAQQMFADNQFFAAEDIIRKEGLISMSARMDVPEQYEILSSQPATGHRLPMSQGQPDFVFSDEENGVVAIKNGEEILYASLYWRARNAINFLARIHNITPNFERIAIVRQETLFEPYGEFYSRPDWIDFGFAKGGHKYPGKLHSAHTGEKLPIAKIPDGVKFEPGDESFYAGKGDFYICRYGRYLIAMNTTKNKTFEAEAPAKSRDLVTGKTFESDQKVKVGPRTTAVFFQHETVSKPCVK